MSKALNEVQPVDETMCQSSSSSSRFKSENRTVSSEWSNKGQKVVRLGLYDVGKTIGKGNFAIVKLSRHRVTKTDVAIKIIDKTRLDGSNLQKVYREIGILKTLNHENIIKLYQVMETKNMLYLVTEYAPNGEIFDYIARNGRLSESEARRIFQQIISAVEYCHCVAGVCHRDLKAENLLLDAEWQIKLADFGFSNYYAKNSTLGTFCGSPPYAAPEVFEGKKYFGTEIDIWSLGVILYVLVCGVLPFDAPTLPLLRDRVLSGRYRIPYFMSSDCESLLRKLLVVESCKRYTLEQVKAHRWMRSMACIDRHFSDIDLNKRQIDNSPRLDEPLEPVLKLMESLGIDLNKTKESLKNKAFDNFTAIYLLLMDRWRSETGVKRRVSMSVVNRNESPQLARNHGRCKRRSPAVAQTHNFASFYRTVDSIGAPTQAQSNVEPMPNEFASLVDHQNSDNDTNSMASDSGVDFSFSDNSSLSRQSTVLSGAQFSFSLDEQSAQSLVTPSPPLTVQNLADSSCDQLCPNCGPSCSYFCQESCAAMTSTSSSLVAAATSTQVAASNTMPQPQRSLAQFTAVNPFENFDSQIEHDFMASLSSCPPNRFDNSGQSELYRFNNLNTQSPAIAMIGNVVGSTSGSFSTDSAPCPSQFFSANTQIPNAAHCLYSTTWSQKNHSQCMTMTSKNLRSSDVCMAPNFVDLNFPRLTSNDRTNGFVSLNVKSQPNDPSDIGYDMPSNSSQYLSESSRNEHQIFSDYGCENSDSPRPHVQLIAKRTNLPKELSYQPSKLLTMKQSLQIEQQLQDERFYPSGNEAKNSPHEVMTTGSSQRSTTSKAAYLHQQRMQTFHQKKQNIQSRRQYFVRQVSYQLAQNQPILPPNIPNQYQSVEQCPNNIDHSQSIRLHQQQKLLHLPTETNFKVESGGRRMVSTPLSPIEDAQFYEKECGEEFMDTS